jgi:hypothetical protein
MRRATSAALVALALTACGSAKASPTVATDNFTPTVQLDIGCPPDVGSPCTANPLLVLTKPSSGDATVGSVAASSVLKITNHLPATQRITGTVHGQQVFDTGQLHEGDSTIVVLDTPGTVVITDTTTGRHTSLTVKPKPGTKG